MPISSTAGDVLDKILVVLELILGQDIDKSDKIEERIEH